MIKCAAIKFPNGNIYIGHYHGECFRRAMEADEPKTPERKLQGFMTKSGRFVGRVEAAEIAINCKQIKKLKYSSTELFSEDLGCFDDKVID